MIPNTHPDIALHANDTSHRERSCWRATCVSLTQQIAFVFASLFIRDGGATLHHAVEAALFSWLPIAVVVCRQATHRAYTPSNIHLAVIRHSFWVLFVALILVSAITPPIHW
jgi:hypothetical protein